ncbi:MAG: MotA/TolQ/ExbB proton channel family protein [Desulfobacteraceae bacterium]
MDITKTLLNLALGGAAWVLWLLIILSIASVAVMIERGLVFYRGRFREGHFVADIEPLMERRDWTQAMDRCAADAAFETQILWAGLQQVEQGKEAVQEAMESERIHIGLLLGKRLPFLGTLGANAPFIGLFGTVLGIIHAFKDLALTENGGGPAVMAGIAEALVATAVGLLVAIPAVVTYNYFHSRLHVVLERSQRLGRLLLTNLQIRPETENFSSFQAKIEGRR